MQDQTVQRYREIPALAGVCTPAEAMRTGLSVEECVRRLKRYHYALRRLHQIFTARITAEPIYELKLGFSLHAHLCAEHVAALRQRVAEMREPPLHLDAVPDPSLEIFFDEILAAPTTEQLVLGLYEKAVPALQAALERHLAETNPLVDHPSVRVCRFALLELADIAAFGAKTVNALVNPATREQTSDWLRLLEECLAASGGLDGTQPPVRATVARQYSAQPYVYRHSPQRDERFQDPYNMGVSAEKFLGKQEFSPQLKVIMLFFKRIQELDVPEMMASIITETPNKPSQYYRDMSRQLWDEARHAMMGQVGFENLGLDWRELRIPLTWSLILNTQLTPFERHAVLYLVEQKLMAKIGKRYEWELAVASGNPLAILFHDYDWADEVLHVQIGRRWYVPEFKNAQQALAYAEESSAKVDFDWNGWRVRGLTEHHNWWSEFYRYACEQWGITPDPQVLAFSETDEAVGNLGPRFSEST